jgi:anti-anti-sigma factor
MIAVQPIHSKPKLERNGNIIIITFIDCRIHTAENTIAKELAVITDGVRKHHLLLDCTNITYINSDDLGTLIDWHKQMRTSGGRLTFFNVRNEVYEVFETTRLHALLEICRQKPLVSTHAGGASRKPYPGLENGQRLRSTECPEFDG